MTSTTNENCQCGHPLRRIEGFHGLIRGEVREFRVLFDIKQVFPVILYLCPECKRVEMRVADEFPLVQEGGQPAEQDAVDLERVAELERILAPALPEGASFDPTVYQKASKALSAWGADLGDVAATVADEPVIDILKAMYRQVFRDRAPGHELDPVAICSWGVFIHLSGDADSQERADAIMQVLRRLYELR